MIKLLFKILFFCGLILSGCGEEIREPVVKTVIDSEAEESAERIETEMSPTVAEGFEVSLWASEDLLSDAIGLDVDDQGRVYVSITERRRNSELDIRAHPDWMIASIGLETAQDKLDFIHQRLAPENSDHNQWITDLNEDGSHDYRDLAINSESALMLEDLTGNARANKSTELVREFSEENTDVAGAVMMHDGDLFVGVSPDMWRIRDTNGDGYWDQKESIAHGFGTNIGFGGHGMSGLTTGPDGRIYWSIGDVGMSVVDQDGKRWHYPRQGVIVRSEPDGSNFEVYAAGLRNTHEFVFDKHGNLITVDNDGDHAGEHERLVYLVNGSDSGWRTNWQFGKYTDEKNNEYKVWMDEEYFKPRWDGQASHVLPPLREFHAGPAGMAYNPGTALNESYNDHFFVMSFRGAVARSPINAFTLREQGASFELASEQEVLRGVLAVGLDFGPDGALYMNDWIRGWDQKNQGRLWKLDDESNAESPARLETKRLLGESFDEADTDILVGYLGHDDMRVRQKAQFELAERGDPAPFEEVIDESYGQLARIHGVWGLAQIGRQSLDAVEPLVTLLNDDDYEIRAQAAKWLGDVRYRPAAESVIPLLQDEHPRVRFFATEALGRMGYTAAFDDVVKMLEENNDEDVYLRHAGAIALARFDDGNALIDLFNHNSAAVRIAAVVALKRLEHPGSAQFLNDSSEFVVTNAARAISDDAFVDEAMPDLAAMLDNPRFDSESLLRRIINANLYGGSPEDAQRLVRFSADTQQPVAMRAEALNTLKFWDAPSIFDRVTGRHRGQIQNNADDARNAWLQQRVRFFLIHLLRFKLPQLKLWHNLS